MKLKKSILAALVLSLSACSQTTSVPSSTQSAQSEQVVAKQSFTYTGGFDTVLFLTAYDMTSANGQAKADELNSIFNDYSQLFDIYNNYDGLNNIKTINDNAGIEPVVVSEEIIDMLQLSKQLYDLSDGEFDITQGAVFKVWHNYREQGLEDNANDKLGAIPTFEELQDASVCTGWDYVEINEEESTVYINDACASLDVGGIAKGYATEKIRTYAQESLDNAFIINAGGNSALVNQKSDGSLWGVGVADPNNPNSTLLAISVGANQSVVTSGDYQRFYVGEDGNRYSHIIDPQTLYPPTYWRSVSIICNDGGIADGLSTILFTLDYESGLAVLEKAKEVFGLDDLGAIWISDNDTPSDPSLSKTINGFTVTYTANLENSFIN